MLTCDFGIRIANAAVDFLVSFLGSLVIHFHSGKGAWSLRKSGLLETGLSVVVDGLPLVDGAVAATEGVALGVLEGVEHGLVLLVEAHATRKNDDGKNS